MDHDAETLSDLLGSRPPAPRTGRRATRRQRDFYETAPWQVDALTDHLPELSGTIWEPCVGDGSLLRRLRENRPDLGPFVTNDLDRAKSADYHLDATLSESWETIALHRGRPDWIVTNPPFCSEVQILQHAVEIAILGVVVMARVSFTEPTRERGPFLAQHPYGKRITRPRYSFTGDGKTDSVTTDWLIWARIQLSSPFGICAAGYGPGLRGKRMQAALTLEIERS